MATKPPANTIHEAALISVRNAASCLRLAADFLADQYPDMSQDLNDIQLHIARKAIRIEDRLQGRSGAR